MQATEKRPVAVAVLVATADRIDLLGRRALPSIASQTRMPGRVVIVDDSGDADRAEQTAKLVRNWRPLDSTVDFLRNRRTKGAAGAWNSGLDHLLRTYGDPGHLYVAILDDDDGWTPHHLQQCMAAAEGRDLDMVVAPFWRNEQGAEPSLVTPPGSLDVSSFLVENPGIQGSNLVCRLSVLLEAGLFDESLPSCTDRDLCIRIADLPGVRYGVAHEPTVHHFACASRARLSTPQSPAKLAGLDRFLCKYRSRMTAAEIAAFSDRAGRLFGWQEPLPRPEPDSDESGERVLPAPLPPDSGEKLHLIAGLIADAERLDSVDSLLGDFALLAENPGLSGFDVLILENGCSRTPARALRDWVERQRSRDMRVHLVDRAHHVSDAIAGLVLDGGASQGRRLAIAHARTVLQSYLYSFAKKRPGAVVWIVDDDMRLDALVIEGERLRRRLQNVVPLLQRLGQRDVDIAIGAYTGAAPLPFAATVRVQLVDLVASLQWLAGQEPHACLPDRSADNAALRADRRDYYYDLSRKETDRLETPFWLTPAYCGESVGQAFERVATTAERILAGEQIFRPLAIAAGIDPLSSINTGLQRGGNTFVFDIEALGQVPNPSPTIDGRPSRRSDMVWALLQQRYFGRQVVTVPIGLYHDRSGIPAGALDVDRVVDDIRGYAMFSALQDVADAFTTRAGQAIEQTDGAPQRLAERVQKYLDERLAAFRLSFYRIRGLVRVLRQLVDDEAAWWHEARYRAVRDELRRFCDQLDRCYVMATLRRIEGEAGALHAGHAREFLDHLPESVECHQSRLSRPHALALRLDSERIANARATVARLVGPDETLSVLGYGSEGVALGDGTRVFKVFDYWESRVTSAQRAFLRTLVGAWTDTRGLYPILDLRESNCDVVLVYPYQPSEPYSGGHGPGLVQLLAECWQRGIVCRNIHPDNLRVVDGQVRLIDYGSDIHPLDSVREFEMMCRRAYLSYRWANRGDLKALMRRALCDTEIAELEGFERFYEAVQRVTGQYETPVELVCEVMGRLRRSPDCEVMGRPRRILDYGCGKGRVSRDMAKLGGQVLGYDPDDAHRAHWQSRCQGLPNLRFTHQRGKVLGAGLFDVVVCRRVLCTIEDDDELRAILRDLRALVAENGRVIVSVCNPYFTFGGPTPEADRVLPAGAQYESTFVWHKRIRASGRVRREVHRTERQLRREFVRAGLAVCRRAEEPTVDLERFEPASDQLAFELEPLVPLPGAAGRPEECETVTLMIKACAMEVATLEDQVRHIVSQLEQPRAFAERLLVLDCRDDGFLRQYARGSLGDLRDVARRLVRRGWIDRVVEGPVDGAISASLHETWFGIACRRGHGATGAQIASTLAGFEACKTRYVLQVDADIMVARLDRSHDYLVDMLAVMADDQAALTVSFNIAMDRDRPYSARGNRGAWRVEVRAGLIDLARLRDARPLPNWLDGERLARPWHRAVDVAVRQGSGRSYRGGDRRTFYVHPPNARKRNAEDWLAVMDRLECGVVPPVQKGNVDWTGTIADWMGPARRESFVFVVSGRNVPAGRFRRCLASMIRQRRAEWGAVVIDDGSDPMFAEHFDLAVESLGQRCTAIRTRRRRGLLANTVTAIRRVCANPESVIVTLDADDALIGDRVLEQLAVVYAQGADVTVGSMLRTDKVADYPVCFDRPRERRGGNVWQHLRSFKKRLFDAIPDHALRLDGDYIDVASDWAFMMPIVEMAENPVHITEPLYFYEPSGAGKGTEREERERVIARIVAKTPLVGAKRSA
ncbi:MAG: glycosyltransferase [Proteobacteria bacterium]|nr:glycosyltransferase [Pseudomonadota bacterium]